MKKKLIYGIFMIFICCYCFLSCEIARTQKEEDFSLYGQIRGGREKGEDEESISQTWYAPVKYIYNNIPAEEYIKRQNAFVPIVLIENSSKGYKILLETGQSYKMETGDCLLFGNGEKMEIMELGFEKEQKKVKKEKDVFIEYDGKQEIVLCRIRCNKLYISYF